jgi:hypothetical protein
VTYMKVRRPHLAKFDARGKKAAFIGYEPSNKAYHIYDLVENRVHVLHDIAFDKSTLWCWEDDDQEEQAGEPFKVEYLVSKLGDRTASGSPAQSPVAPPAGPRKPSNAPVPAPAPMVFVTPPTITTTLMRLHAISSKQLTSFAEAEQDEC